MKVTIYEEEWWPVFMLEPHDPESKLIETQIEVPDELYDRYTEVMKQFDEVQAEIVKLYPPAQR
jgi:hypothetical protein